MHNLFAVNVFQPRYNVIKDISNRIPNNIDIGSSLGSVWVA